MGVSDIESVKVQGCTFTAVALRNLVARPGKKPDLTIFCGEAPVNEYNNLKLMMGMFPTLFLYGISGFEKPDQKVSVSFQKQANYYLDIVDRSFRRHNSFIFVTLNIFQHHQVHLTCLHTHFAVGSANFESVTRDIVNVQPQMVLDIAVHLEQEGSVQSLTSEQKRVFTLLSQVKTIAMKVSGSEALKIMYHNEIRSYIRHFSISHLFFMANPNPLHSPLFQLMWGDKMVNLNARMLEMVESIKRGMHLAEDPVAALDFFNFSVCCVMEYLFGWDFEKRRSTEKGGLLGHIRSFYGMGELTEWGMYHMHFLITLYGGLIPADIHKKMAESDEFQAQFFDLFNNMICHDLLLDMPFGPEADPRTETTPHVPGPNATDEELERFL
ncbi:hypothetical protein EDD85DRAFT_782365 [Armillaria nabsnona]|nr:hypothetical protein EDD85DRAFT_782365 [Armillaria nabsnona]